MGFGERTGNVIAVSRKFLHDQERRGGCNAFFRPRPLTSYATTELSGRRRSEGGTSLPDRVQATIGDDNVHDNDGNRGVVPGGKAVGATVPTSERGGKPFLCGQQEGGGGGCVQGGVHKAV